MVEMEKALLKKLCRDHDLYVTPAINDKLYLHYKGFRCIKNLDEYTGLKVLWLEGNGLPRIEGLEHQTQLKTLYLQENLIQHIENLDAQTGLDTLNLSQNQISCIENLGHMKELSSLSLKSNYLSTAKDLEHVLELPNLSVLDVQSNRIADPAVLDVLSKMPNLKVLYLQGNDVVKHIKQYRKTLVYRCRKLKYLDDRPVFEDERRRIDAWGKALDASNGDFKAAQEAERVEMEAIRQEKRDRDRLNFLHFEQLMAEGRRKRAEEEAAKAAAASNQNDQSPHGPEQSEVNPFSGEKIVPVQDCEFLQRQREERWEQVVNAPEAWSKSDIATTAAASQEDNQAENSTSSETRASAIPVDVSRLALLHQCATVGTGLSSAMEEFVDSSFRVDDQSPQAMPPPAPVTTASREPGTKILGKKAESTSELGIEDNTERLPPATQLALFAPALLDEPHSLPAPPSTSFQMEASSSETTPMTMPPPAPVATTKPPTVAKTTNVDELD